MKVVIFCGGYGTRMWPASRKSYPKQFFPLIKGKSFFQSTYERFRGLFGPSDIYVSTEERYIKFVREQEPGIPIENLIAEPERKDNLAAIGLVTAILENRFPGEVMITSWSDHFVSKVPEFLKSVKIAGDYAKTTGLVVSVDSEPRYPAIHLGWVKLGRVVGEVDRRKVISIEKQVEKPDEETAKKFLKDGGYLWNTGYLAWRTDVMMEYYKSFAPNVFAGLEKIIGSQNEKNHKEVLSAEYHKFKKQSIDYGILEKLPAGKRVAIPTDFGWEDAGTWELFYRALRVNENQNVTEGQAYTQFIESGSNLVIGPEGKVIGVIGLSNVAIIDTPDGLLVANLPDTGKVKELFDNLEMEKPEFVK
jgi:mannose-1-phosphate guanylyltransferase